MGSEKAASAKKSALEPGSEWSGTCNFWNLIIVFPEISNLVLLVSRFCYGKKSCESRRHAYETDTEGSEKEPRKKASGVENWRSGRQLQCSVRTAATYIWIPASTVLRVDLVFGSF